MCNMLGNGCLESGERVTMPLRPVTFVMRFPADFAKPS